MIDFNFSLFCFNINSNNIDFYILKNFVDFNLQFLSNIDRLSGHSCGKLSPLLVQILWDFWIPW